MYKQFISYNARGCKKYSPGTIVPFGEYCVQPLLSDGHELCEWTEGDSGNRGRYLKVSTLNKVSISNGVNGSEMSEASGF